MKKEFISNGCWVSCDSYAALVATLPKNVCKLFETSDANSWGYLNFDSDLIVPIGYADMGLLPVGMRGGDHIFVGIGELVVCYGFPSLIMRFSYKMPTIFHEFVTFAQDMVIVRDEIGFVGLSYDGVEQWSFCIDVIASYEIVASEIIGKTAEGENFVFTIPST